jgi:hypothetical protein
VLDELVAYHCKTIGLYFSAFSQMFHLRWLNSPAQLVTSVLEVAVVVAVLVCFLVPALVLDLALDPVPEHAAGSVQPNGALGLRVVPDRSTPGLRWGCLDPYVYDPWSVRQVLVPVMRLRLLLLDRKYFISNKHRHLTVGGILTCPWVEAVIP